MLEIQFYSVYEDVFTFALLKHRTSKYTVVAFSVYMPPIRTCPINIYKNTDSNDLLREKVPEVWEKGLPIIIGGDFN